MPSDPPVRLEALESDGDGRRFSSSVARNREHVVAVLAELLPSSGTCLEVAAGTGEHAVLAASRLPQWRWLATDRNEEALLSIAAWARHAGLDNLRAIGRLDLTEPWPVANASLDAVFASNLMHISPIETTAALFAGAARHLRPRGALLVYGAVFLPTGPRPESNITFDEELRARDPGYGVRELSELEDIAAGAGLASPEVHAMPANNVMLRFHKR